MKYEMTRTDELHMQLKSLMQRLSNSSIRITGLSCHITYRAKSHIRTLLLILSLEREENARKTSATKNNSKMEKTA
jgi:hypothetical protein